MNFLEKLELLCFQQKLSKRQFSIKSGIPYTTIDGLYKRGYERMQLCTMVSICDFFQVTMDSMARDDKEIVFIKDLENHDLSIYDSMLLDEYRSLTPEGKERVDYTLRAELELSKVYGSEKKMFRLVD